MIRCVMPMVGTWKAFRAAARGLLAQGVAPEDVVWQSADDAPDLFGAEAVPVSEGLRPVPKAFVEMASLVVCHDSVERFSLPYQVLWRLQHNPRLFDNPAEPQVARMMRLAKAVGRDSHKMKAFVRFREGPSATARRGFSAWFEPEHYVVEHVAPFFARRFADMDWTIATPKGVAIFEAGRLRVAPALPQRPPALDDETEALWQTYYAHIFNPARLKVKAMKSEMPVKYWKNLPEAALIPELIAGAAARALEMQVRAPTEPRKPIARIKAPAIAPAAPVPESFESLAALHAAAAACQRCALHCAATQTVPGEGGAGARLMFVGEQPGDEEDLQGRPFVGPAGQIFMQALAAAGLARADVYITNAVKHFKFQPRGRRRIHERPNAAEVSTCRWWLEQEIKLVQPRLIIAMGATAALSLTGEKLNVGAVRGRFQQSEKGAGLLITYHPSAILRNADQADTLRKAFFEDIRAAARFRDKARPQA